MAFSKEEMGQFEELFERKLEEKFDEKLKPIYAELAWLKEKVNYLEQYMKQEFRRIDRELEKLNTRLNLELAKINDRLDLELTAINDRLDRIIVMESEDVQAAYTDIEKLKFDTEALRGRVGNLESLK